jgi:hypothetical protein
MIGGRGGVVWLACSMACPDGGKPGGTRSSEGGEGGAALEPVSHAHQRRRRTGLRSKTGPR